MKFLPPPYLLSLGLDCPPNMTMGTADPLDTVHCPSQAQKDELLRGVERGDIGLWGVPFNMQVRSAALSCHSRNARVEKCTANVIY